MEEFVSWIIKNKEWLFSGVGLVVAAWLARLIFKKINASSSQTIRAGNNSTNIQAGRDVGMVKNTNRNDVE